MKMVRPWLLILAAILGASLVLSCSSPAPTTTPAKTAAPTTAAATTAPAKTSAPATTAAPTATSNKTAAAEFYSKNTVTNVVTAAAGGGTDYIARIMAAYWSDVVEGGTMVVKNMGGGGGLAGPNWLYKSAKPDGLTIQSAYTPTAPLSPAVFKTEGVEYDVTKYEYIGSLIWQSAGLVVTSKLPYKTMDELKNVKGLRFGAIGLDDRWAQMSALVINVYGLQDAKIVSGYTGTSDMGLAIAKGEIDVAIPGDAVFVDWRGKGWVGSFLITIDNARSAVAPDIPTIGEANKLSDFQKKMLDIIMGLQGGGAGQYPTYAPPGTPADKVQFLRDTFIKLTKLSAFMTQLKVRFPDIKEPIVWPGDKVAEATKKVMTISSDDVAQLRQLIRSYVR